MLNLSVCADSSANIFFFPSFIVLVNKNIKITIFFFWQTFLFAKIIVLVEFFVVRHFVSNFFPSNFCYPKKMFRPKTNFDQKKWGANIFWPNFFLVGTKKNEEKSGWIVFFSAKILYMVKTKMLVNKFCLLPKKISFKKFVSTKRRQKIFGRENKNLSNNFFSQPKLF